MIITYVSDKPNSFQKNNDYFCIEIYVDLRMNNVSYTVINIYGEIAIYDSEYFVIKQGDLDNMIFVKNNSFNSYVIQLKEIHELDKKCDDVNGIWGAYHNGNKEVEDRIHDIVMRQANRENFPLEKVVAV